MNYRFITNDENIRNAFLELRISESKQPIDRHYLYDYINHEPDFCRGLEIQDYLKNNILDENNTIIYIHGGYKISGLLNFKVLRRTINDKRTIQTQGICVSNGEKKGTGKNVLSVLKLLAEKLDIEQIVVFSVDESKGFYIKNGFVELEEGTNYFIFDLKKRDGGIGKNKNKTFRKNKRKHKKRKMTKRK
jgi:hypothetical protein